MKKRLITGSIILLVTAIFLLTTRYTTYAFDLFVGVLAVMGCVEVSRVLERKKIFTNIIFIGSFPAILYIAMSIGIIKERDWVYFLVYFLVVFIALALINFLYTIIFKKITIKEKAKYDVVEMHTAKYGMQKALNSAFVMIYSPTNSAKPIITMRSIS